MREDTDWIAIIADLAKNNYYEFNGKVVFKKNNESDDYPQVLLRS